MNRGFTLIEVLVAVGILTLMAALMYGIINSVFRVSDDMDDIVEVNHMARVTMNRLTRDLSHAFLTLNQGEQEKTKTIFIGEEERVLFCYFGNIPVLADGRETDQGVVEYRLSGRSEGRDGQKLIRRFKPILDDDPEDGGEEYVIASGVKKLELAYWDATNEDWESSWDADDPLSNVEPGYELPSRVKIHLELYGRDGHVHIFETQTSIYVTRPLLFGQPTNAAAAQWQAAQGSQNPLQNIPGVTPAGTTPGTTSPTTTTTTPATPAGGAQ